MTYSSLAGGLALLAVTGLPAWANAAIVKCTGADGKVVFSDQPCASHQTGAIVKPAATPKASSPAASNTPMPDAQARISATLSPQCAAIAEKIRGFVMDGTGAALESEVKATVARFDAQCADSMRKATTADNARQQAEQKRLMTASECRAKKRVVQERRARPGGVIDADRAAIAAIDSDIARSCP